MNDVGEAVLHHGLLKIGKVHLGRLPELGGVCRDAGSAAGHSGSEHKHGVGSLERRGVVCALLPGGDGQVAVRKA